MASERLPLRPTKNNRRSVTIPVMTIRISPLRPVHVYLKDWREHLGLTQQQVGDRIPPHGVDKATVSRWETARRTPSLNVIAAFAEALGIPIGDLYRKPGDGPSIDSMLAHRPDIRRQILEIIPVLLKQGT